MIIEAIIASQLIGARREAREAYNRGKFTYEDDLRLAKIIAVIVFLGIGPLLWPIGVFYNTDINKRKYIYYPCYAACIIIGLGSFVFYYIVGATWTVYTLFTLNKLVARCEEKKRSRTQVEEEIVYDGEADVILEMTVCECGCGAEAKKYTLKPR